MTRPYTSQPVDALVIGGTSLAAVLTMLLWRRPPRLRVTAVPLLAAIWLAALVPLGSQLPASYEFTERSWALVLRACSVVGGLALLATSPMWIGSLGLVWAAFAIFVMRRVPESLPELTAFVQIGLATMAGVMLRVREADAVRRSSTEPDRRSLVRQDLVIFAAVVLLAVFVSSLVLERSNDSDDEWGYTFDALLFAHGRAYGHQPQCPEVLRAHWIFYNMGKAFPQYTPGWPLFMAPFALIGAVWLAGPFAHGLFAVGCARLARRAAASAPVGPRPASTREVSWAGFVAAALATTGASPLLTGASRYPHMFVLAMFAWAAEAIFQLTDLDRTIKAQVLWSALLGVACAEMLGARPLDGGLLGLPLFVYFVWGLIKRRIGAKDVAAAAVPFVVLGGLQLLILRLQVDRWLTTGYAFAKDFYTWGELKFELPEPNELRYAFPLYYEAYMFWPASTALGIVGLLRARGREARIAWLLCTVGLLWHVPYVLLNFTRSGDFGYGPRYFLPLVMIGAVGGALALLPLRRSAAGWVAAAALITGTVRIGALVYPEIHVEIHQRNGVKRAVAREHLHQAVVTVATGATYVNAVDLAENDPTDKHPDVLYAGEGSGPEQECLRRVYTGRKFYRAQGRDEVTLTEY